jgi:hypothetical protein
MGATFRKTTQSNKQTEKRKTKMPSLHKKIFGIQLYKPKLAAHIILPMHQSPRRTLVTDG